MIIGSLSQKISSNFEDGKRYTALRSDGPLRCRESVHLRGAEGVKIIGVREGQQNSSALRNHGGY